MRPSCDYGFKRHAFPLLALMSSQLERIPDVILEEPWMSYRRSSQELDAPSQHQRHGRRNIQQRQRSPSSCLAEVEIARLMPVTWDPSVPSVHPSRHTTQVADLGARQAMNG